MKTWIIGVVVAVLTLGFVGSEVGWWTSADNDTTVVTFAGPDGADLAERLAPAEAAHGICYGWQLEDKSRNKVLSVGSSRGDGVDATTCERYLVLEVEVTYTSASSEADDSAALKVLGSPELRMTQRPSNADLDRMGITSEAALAEPAATTGYGVLALPLLLAERGIVDPLPEPVAAGAPTAAIGRPGSDFAGNHGTALVLLAVFGGIALLSAALGATTLARRRRQGR